MRSLPTVSFGALLRRYRLHAGLTQEALAERANLGVETISTLERGTRRAPRQETIALLAEALGLSPAERDRLQHVARGQGATLAPASVHHLPSLREPLLPLAGRKREVAQLVRHLAGGGPPLLLFEGEPGIGKSRLLAEASQRARAQDWKVLSGGSHRRNGQEPYAPLLGALESVLHRSAPAALRAHLEGCAWLARLLPELAETTLVPAPAWSLPPEQERGLMFVAVGRFLANVADPAGTVLLLDDLQWAGADALDLLAALLRSPVPLPLRIIGAYRRTEVHPPDVLSVLVADLAVVGLAAQHRLEPLAPEEAAALLNSLLEEGEEADVERRAHILTRTGGVPFFLVSCAQALKTGTPARSGADAPWNVAESIRQRVAALPEGAQELLGTAAVIGREAPTALLLALAPHSEADTLVSLKVLSQTHLLVEEGEATSRFTHDLIREVVLADLSLAERRSLHRQVAQALEQEPGEAPLQLLAHHYLLAGGGERAVLYLERAGDQALALHAHVEAERCYRDLVTHLGQLHRPLDTARACEKLGKLLGRTAHLDEALEVLTQAEAIYRTSGDQERQWLVIAQIGHIHAEHGTAVEGLRLLLPLLEAPGPGASTQVLTEVYGAVAHLNFNLVRYPESLAAREQALKWARLAQDDGLLVSALAGHYQLALGPNVGAQQAGCNFSRFTYLLGKESADALRDTASRVAALTPNVLLAEIVYLPRSGRASNVAIHPTIYRHELNYAAPPEVGGDKTIPLNELLVGLYNERFYLRWPRRDAQVIPCVGHMLNPMGAPAIVRMLADMRLDGTALLSAFDWGEARSFPFLPRVQLDRFVLSLAQWQFTPYMRDRELPSTSSETFRASLTAWREQWNVPRYVYLTTHDNRLLLDLDSPQQSDELRYELQKLEEDHVVVLQEVFPTLDQIWVQGPGGHYVAEFIIPLISRASINVQDNKARATKVVGLGPSPVPQAFPQKFSPEQRLKGLGSEWLFMKLYCGQALQDDLIAGPLQEFARDALKTGLAEDWFFIRYNDPDPHIRLRFWGDSRLLQSKLLPMLCDWGAWLISKGPCLKYTFDVYDREIERYGGLAGIEVAERLFGADSRAVADLLALLTRRPGIQLERELLAVLSNDDLLAGLGLSASARLALYRQWMRRRHQSGQTYRQKKAQLRLLLGNPSKALADIPGGTEIMAVLVRRREALLSISARLAEVNAQQTSSQPLSSLYASYLHMHCNRLLGTDRALEEEVTDLLLRTWEGLEYAPIS